MCGALFHSKSFSGIQLTSLSSPTFYRLARCKLTEESCKEVASAVQYMFSLKELDLSGNNMNITGINLLNEALSRPRCKLQILRLLSDFLLILIVLLNDIFF